MFLVIYQREPHARQMAFKDRLQPANYAERLDLARRMRDELQLEIPILVDGMDDASRALFGDLPSPAIVIDPGRVVRIKLPWAEPEVLGPRLAALLEDPIAGITPASPWHQRMGAALYLLRRDKVGEATARLQAIAATRGIIETDIHTRIRPVIGDPGAMRIAASKAAALARALDHDPVSRPALDALRTLLASSGAAPWHRWARRVIGAVGDK